MTSHTPSLIERLEPVTTGDAGRKPWYLTAPAPSAGEREAKYPAEGTAPWSEDEENTERLVACEKRRKRYGNESCDCDHDGACTECEYDMQDVMKKRYSTAPKPLSSPGERMREALADFATSAAFASRGALDSDTVFCEIYTPGYQPQKKGSFGFYVKDLRNLLALAALALQGPSGKTGGEG